MWIMKYGIWGNHNWDWFPWGWSSMVDIHPLKFKLLSAYYNGGYIRPTASQNKPFRTSHSHLVSMSSIVSMSVPDISDRLFPYATNLALMHWLIH